MPNNMPANLSKTDFFKKYDNGKGWDWSIDWGGDWDGDWGFGPNSEGNNKIFPAEVEKAGGVDKLVEDFKQLSINDQRSVSRYFKSGLSEKILAKIESPDEGQTSYDVFKKKFDNGETTDDSEGDDWYGGNEIIAGGAYLSFKRDLSKLPLFARLFAQNRMTEEVKNNLNKNATELFWESYDRNRDRNLSESEIRYVGWNNFKLDILELGKSVATGAFDRMLNAPPPDVMALIKENFPEYLYPYNLRQFPSARDEFYKNAREGMEVVDAITGRRNVEISRGMIPPFGHPLTRDYKDRFHVALFNHLASLHPKQRVNFSTLSGIMERAKNQGNAATINKLRQALRSEDAGRYVGYEYTVSKGHARLWDSKYSNVGKAEDITLRDDMHTKKFINAVRKLKGVEMSEDTIEVWANPDPNTPPKTKTVNRYRARLPYKRADLYFALCEDIGWFFDRNCITMKTSKEFPRYAIDTKNERIAENWLNEDKLQIDMLRGDDIRVKIQISDEREELLHSGFFYVEPDIDLWSRWGIMEERRVYP